MMAVICDDHRLFGESLKVVLEAKDHHVAAVTTTPLEAVQAVRAYHPDVCIMDLTFPALGLDGVEGARLVIEGSPETAVLILTAGGDATACARAIAVGVTGFVLKDQGVEGVLDSITRVAIGEVIIDRLLLRAALRLRQAPLTEVERLASFLTPREQQVLGLITQGYSTDRIAHTTGVAYSTARTHIQNTLFKLGVHSRLEASALAVAHNLVPTQRQPG